MLTLTIFIILLALFFDFLNGMNDAANSIATVVSTRVLSPKMAVLWAAFFNFVAAFGFGVHVANTIGKGIVHPTVTSEGMILAALVGAIIWTHFCTKYGLPISVSHSLIGGLAGSAIAKAGWAALITSGLMKVALFIVLSPIIGLVLGMLLMIAVNWIYRRSNVRSVDRTFRVGQLLSSAAFGLGHGTNDAQKTMGIIAVLLFTTSADIPPWLYDKSGGFYVPVWIILAAHSAIGLGTLAGGWKVIRTMGMRLTHLKPIGGFCAESAGAAVLVGTAIAGIPVSTTHTISGAIMGVGSVRRLSAVRWGIAGKIVWAWILTIPISALIGGVAYLIVSQIM
ncbi:MAG: inorganic phosphate transporter [Ignavibacteriae bacterium]|nr:inorganic phosphate transporter [Ignavibacteriota bacterium]